MKWKYAVPAIAIVVGACTNNTGSSSIGTDSAAKLTTDSSMTGLPITKADSMRANVVDTVREKIKQHGSSIK